MFNVSLVLREHEIGCVVAALAVAIDQAPSEAEEARLQEILDRLTEAVWTAESALPPI